MQKADGMVGDIHLALVSLSERQLGHGAEAASVSYKERGPDLEPQLELGFQLELEPELAVAHARSFSSVPTLVASSQLRLR